MLLVLLVQAIVERQAVTTILKILMAVTLRPGPTDFQEKYVTAVGTLVLSETSKVQVV